MNKIESKINMNDILKMCEWLEIAIKREIFIEKELLEIFPIVEKTHSYIDSVNRRLEFGETLDKIKKKNKEITKNDN